MLAAALFVLPCTCLATAQVNGRSEVDVWTLARSKRAIECFSTIFTAHDVRDRLKTEEGIDRAIAWCKHAGITKVYVESFRSGVLNGRPLLSHISQRFRAAGLEVSGCITTTGMGKVSSRGDVDCFTDPATQDRLEEIFTYTAGLFDEIIIDDYWFTDCECAECDAARRARTVKIGENTYPVHGESWPDYRCELLTRLSQDRIMAPAHRVNPNVRLIVKFPNWYDCFRDRGYDVMRETAAFDRIWVGCETRDPDSSDFGRTPQYEAYFAMRWLGGIGGAKCGGGWYDPFSTNERTYVEQARQTVLGGARESLLFAYGAFQPAGQPDLEALRTQIPELISVAEQVRRRKPIGIAAYKPPSSPFNHEGKVYDYVGMMGLPLAPCHTFPASARAAFFGADALNDASLPRKLSAFIATGRPTLVTDGLARGLEGRVDLHAPNVHLLMVGENRDRLLLLPQSELDALRKPFLKALGASLEAPNRVALYLFSDGSRVVENFNDTPASVTVNGESLTVAARGWTYRWERK
jgi:hypothetical protein